MNSEMNAAAFGINTFSFKYILIHILYIIFEHGADCNHPIRFPFVLAFIYADLHGNLYLAKLSARIWFFAPEK